MMNSKKIIKEQLGKLVLKYPTATIKYYFDSLDGNHFVCIRPKIIFDKIIANQEAMRMDMAFMEQFHDELLSFVDDDFLNNEELVYERTFAIGLGQYSRAFEFPKSIEVIQYPQIICEMEDEEYAFAA